MAAHDIKSDIVIHVSYPSRANDEESGVHLGELDTASHPTAINEVETLPRQDGGRGAWLFLAGAWIIEGITWGQCS